MSAAAAFPPPARRVGPSPGHSLRLLAAFAAIYLIWGSTYLAIKVVVAFVPPLLVAAARCLLAGAILLAWAVHRGSTLPSRHHWAMGGLAGILMFLIGHGTLYWASQRVPSGFAAILVATIPLWVVGFGAIGLEGRLPDIRTLAGLAIGIGGIVALNLPAMRGTHDPLASLALLAGAAAWAVAILWYTGRRRPDSSVLAAAIPLITGGSLLLAASLLTEHPAPGLITTLPFAAIASFGYMVVFGSVVALSAFTWLIQVAHPAAVASYAFVNPIVAVFLGWSLGGEAYAPTTLLPAGAVVVAVMLIVSARRHGAAR